MTSIAKKYIRKVYFEIFDIAPNKIQIKECLEFLKGNKNNIKSLINHLIVKKYKKNLELHKKYKEKYENLKKLKTTEYELIQLSRQYKEILDKKNREIERLRFTVPITPFRSYNYYTGIFSLPEQ